MELDLLLLAGAACFGHSAGATPPSKVSHHQLNLSVLSLINIIAQPLPFHITPPNDTHLQTNSPHR